jgi:hypothetical protein
MTTATSDEQLLSMSSRRSHRSAQGGLLMNQTVLTTPQTIEGWLENLSAYVTQLELQLRTAGVDLRLLDAEAANSLLQGLTGTLRTIVDSLRANGRQIAHEVGEYRTAKDAEHAQTRLRRLIDLYDAYLEPLIRVIDIHGDFYAATDRVSDCCVRLCDLANQPVSAVAEAASLLKQEIVGLRQIAIQAAEEALRELGPLCEAAVRESQIAVGVNRALEAVRLGQWDRLALDENLTVVDDRNGPLFSDRAVDRYLDGANTSRSRSPHIILGDPELLDIPAAADSLIDKLELIESVDDLLAWILDVCDWIDLDQAVRLLHSVIERCPDQTHPTEERHDYTHDHLIVQAARWYWGDRDASQPTTPHRESDAQAIGPSVPVA